VWKEVVHHTDSAVQQQQQEEANAEYFTIPSRIKIEHGTHMGRFPRSNAGSILTPTSRRRRTSSAIATPWRGTGHPLKISFCDNCGDYFARTDSLERHRKKPPLACRSATSEEAKEKLRETQKIHDEFMERLKGFLRTGEDIGMPFSRIIKEKYPDSSSKKRTGGSRERSRLEGC
jgi:hypothetical protein